MNWTFILAIASFIISILMNLSVKEPVSGAERVIAIILGTIIVFVVAMLIIGVLGAWAVLALIAFAIAEGSRGDGIQ